MTINDNVALPCSGSNTGNIASCHGTNNFNWTLFTYSFTASASTANITFTFETDANRNFYFDDASVTDNSAPMIELLQNPGFENSSSVIEGWTVSYSGTGGPCSNNGTITSGALCNNGSGNCFYEDCGKHDYFEILSQTFGTTIGNNYTISYYLQLTGSGGTGHTFLDVSIF